MEGFGSGDADLVGRVGEEGVQEGEEKLEEEGAVGWARARAAVFSSPPPEGAGGRGREFAAEGEELAVHYVPGDEADLLSQMLPDDVLVVRGEDLQ